MLSHPVTLEHVGTNLTIDTHIWVEDLSQEVTLGWGSRTSLPNRGFAQNRLPSQGAAPGPLMDMQVGDVLLIGM